MTTSAELLSPSRAGMSCSVCLMGIQGDGEESRTPQGRGREPLNGLWAGVCGEKWGDSAETALSHERVLPCCSHGAQVWNCVRNDCSLLRV